MFVLVRAITYAVLFVGVVLVVVPARVLARAGITGPSAIGPLQIAGILVAAAGGAVALWCILTFALIGKGTPAPFDPPRRLVVRGPYRFVRNPMYLGAGTALAGAALCYQSPALLGYTGLFFLVTHLFVVWYEEPTLRRTFAAEYRTYCRQVFRWRPRLLTTRQMEVATLNAFATNYTAAWCSQDAARVASFFAEKGSLTINEGTPSVGRSAITAAAQQFMTAFPDMLVKMESVTREGGHVVFRWTLTGTNTGPGGTGKAVRISGYEEWTRGDDGLIAESQGHFDEAEYRRQVSEGV